MGQFIYQMELAMTRKSQEVQFGELAISRFGKRFASDVRGTVAIIFAFSIVILVGVVGGAVDYGRWMSARSKQQAAIDAAVLAAGRVFQVTDGNVASAVNAAQQYYGKLRSSLVGQDSTTFTVSSDGKTVSATSVASVKTPFLSAAGVVELPVNISARAVISSGGNSDSSVEISLMLDVTGSMGGQKIADLKLAAKDMIDIVVWSDQSKHTSRVAIAPFSEHVNVGRTDYEAVVGSAPPGTGTSRTCVRERSGADRYTDAAPGAGNWFEPGAETWSCKPQSTILPLTNDKSALKAHIDGLSTDGYTAGHLGTAWAWYLLSPKWNSVWSSGARADSYNTKTRKIAVLMSDGEYNRQYSGSRSAEQARAICANMKLSGITVYTIGFQIAAGGEAYQTLSQCASSSSHFFNSTTGDELRQAFREIALQVVTLRLSN